MPSTQRQAADGDGPGGFGFGVERVEIDDSNAELRFTGRMSLRGASSLWLELKKLEPMTPAGGTLNFDMSGVEAVDGGAMALLAHARAELMQRRVRSEFVGASERVQQLIHLYRGDVSVERRKRRKARGLLGQIGQASMGIVIESQLVLAFLGQLVVSAAGLLRAPRSANWKDLTPTMERTGADAVPIVLMINFLVGLVMAFQASVQLRQFGANILVADLIGISMTRELGPLMTAIVVSGRSGAAFAAELGSMKVNEEIDALRTMGFGPMRFLVLPRTLALMLVMPLLALLADFVGVLGGLVVGITSLNLSAIGYFQETQKALSLWDISSGVIKSAVFGLAIGLISCQQGLATTGGAEEVGRRTTSAVVTCLFTLIVIDAVFTVCFRLVGL